MQKSGLCRCEKCGKEFAPVLSEKKAREGIVICYFACPNCGQKTIAFCTNNSIRKKQHKVKALYAMLRSLTRNDIAKGKDLKLTQKIYKMKTTIRSEMDELKKKQH